MRFDICLSLGATNFIYNIIYVFIDPFSQVCWKYVVLWLSLMFGLLFWIVVGPNGLWCKDILLYWCCIYSIGCSKSVRVQEVLLMLLSIFILFRINIFDIMDVLVYWSRNSIVFFGCCGMFHCRLWYSMLIIPFGPYMICERKFDLLWVSL